MYTIYVYIWVVVVWAVVHIHISIYLYHIYYYLCTIIYKRGGGEPGPRIHKYIVLYYIRAYYY